MRVLYRLIAELADVSSTLGSAHGADYSTMWYTAEELDAATRGTEVSTCCQLVSCVVLSCCYLYCVINMFLDLNSGCHVHVIMQF